MEKPVKRINLLAKKIGIESIDIAMILIYIISHDKKLAWGQTYGQHSKSKNHAAMAQKAFNLPKIVQFIKMIGGTIAINTSLYLSMRGLPNDGVKQLNNILSTCLIDSSSGAYRLDKIEYILSYAIDHGLSLDTIISEGDNMSGVRTKMPVIMAESEKEKNETIFIKFTANMSRAEYLDYLIQEQGRTATQKEKNAFTLKISDFMNFKDDKSNELKPLIYLCDRQHISYLKRLSSVAKGSFNR